VVHDHVDQAIEKIRKHEGQDKRGYLHDDADMNIPDEINEDDLQGHIQSSYQSVKRGVNFIGAIQLHGCVKLRLLNIEIIDLRFLSLKPL